MNDFEFAREYPGVTLAALWRGTAETTRGATVTKWVKRGDGQWHAVDASTNAKKLEESK